MKIQNSNHGIGGAHIGAANGAGFGRRAPLLGPEDGSGGGGNGNYESYTVDGAAAPADGGVAFTPEQQRVVGAMIGQARREGREAALRGGGQNAQARGGQNAPQNAGSPDAVATAVATAMAQAMPRMMETFAQMMNPQAAQPRFGQGPAAPTAPGMGPGAGGMPAGMVDIWNLSVAQIEELGPEGIREAHERILDHANKRGGAPRVPFSPPKRGGR
jgi:hypothetical protein